ncbi:YfjI family protein [Yunchengibacter salinarum]|uniref:YfjI family protein n=1 Tax=Yunchengibacter salinarum TaxID=3133399 RepID=UPI0035B64E28
MTIAQEIPAPSDGPEPIVAQSPRPATFPVEALGPLRPAVEAVQGQTQAPVAIPAGSALAVASLAVQGLADVETLGGYAPLSLYLLTIARSGERKSACDRPLMAALRDHEREQGAHYGAALVDHENAKAVWENQRTRLIKEAASNKPDARKAAEQELDILNQPPEPPALPDRTVSEPTFEGLTRLFATGNPSLGIFSDEGGQMLGGHGMSQDHRQKTITALSALWGGEPIKRTRAGDGAFTLWGRRLAIHLMAQPVVTEKLLADPLAQGQGFLARFLITEPPSTIGTRLHARNRHDPAALDAFNARLRDILGQDMPRQDTGGGLNPRQLPLSPEARERLIVWADQIEAAQAPGGTYADMTASASKAAEQAARLAGVLTLWANPDAPAVDGEAMDQGITLAAYYLDEAKRLTDKAAVSEAARQAEALRHWLVNGWPEPDVLPGDVLQKAPTRALRDREAARRALARLVDAGWLVPHEAGAVVRGKARREAYRIVRP